MLLTTGLSSKVTGGWFILAHRWFVFGVSGLRLKRCASSTVLGRVSPMMALSPIL